VGPRNFVLDGGPDPHEKKQFMGFRSGSNPYECKDGCNCKGECVSVMRPFAILLWTLV